MSGLALAGLLLAWGWDARWGEPPARWHPVVWMGRYLQWAGPRWCGRPPAVAFVGGLLAWTLGAALVVTLAWGAWQGLQWLASEGPWGFATAALLLAALLKPMFAWRMLHDEVQAVGAALHGSLDADRVQLQRLVSRDTASLQAHEVREAAIETLAENLNDSLVAPLLWWAIGGLPAAALYRYANTADAMWGYRGRWEWAGKAAARIDDAMSWLPARLAAVMLLPRPRQWPALRQQARRTPSPNGGWPMGAMALALGIALRKPGVYALNDHARSPQHADIDAALQRARRAARAAFAGVALLLALLAIQQEPPWR